MPSYFHMRTSYCIRVILAIFLLFSTLSSCQKTPVVDLSKYNINFDVAGGWEEKPVSSAFTDFPAGSYFGWLGYVSSGTAWSGDEIPDFYNIKMNSDGSYAGPKSIWPSAGSMSIFAYYPYEDQSQSDKVITLPDINSPGYPTVIYNTPADISEQRDFLFGAVMNSLSSGHKDISLRLPHKLTRVDVSAALSTNQDRSTVIVKKVTLIKVNMKGDYSYAMDLENAYNDNIDWTKWKNPWTVSYPPVTQDVVIYEGEGIPLSTLFSTKLGSDTAFLVPQTVGNGSSCSRVRVEYQINDTRITKNVTLPSMTWGAGMHVSYDVTINPTNAAINVSFTINPWEDVRQTILMGSAHRTLSVSPSYETLQARHPQFTNFADLWRGVYMGNNGSNYASSSDFNSTFDTSKKVRIIASIFNVEKEKGGLYEGERIFQISLSGFQEYFLDWDLPNLSNFRDGDVLICYVPFATPVPLYVFSYSNNASLIGPAFDDEAYAKHEWVTRTYEICGYGDLVDCTDVDTVRVNSLLYNTVKGPGYFVLRRTALNNK